jgi:hypothetical protein
MRAYTTNKCTSTNTKNHVNTICEEEIKKLQVSRKKNLIVKNDVNKEI